MNKKTQSNLPETIGSKVLASIAGVTERRLYQLADANEIPKAENGEFPFRETLLSLFRYHRRDPEKLRSEKLALITARREREQLRLGKEAEELVYAEQAQKLWDNAILMLRDVITSADIPEATKRKIFQDLQVIPLADYQGEKSKAAATANEPE